MKIYRSNLLAPDLLPQFKHAHVRKTAFGHAEISDWSDKADDDLIFGLYKRCGFWTHDEVAILYHVARSAGGNWLDIGTLTGWTAAHLAAAGCQVVTIDPQLWHPAFYERMASNLERELIAGQVLPWPGTSEDYFRLSGYYRPVFSGVVIDGNHDRPEPARDALSAIGVMDPARHIILFHDFMGDAVQAAARMIKDLGYQVRIYNTPNMIACCWKGEWTPPDHTPDPKVDWDEVQRRHIKEFPL